MVVASKPWSAIGEALVQGLHKIYGITLGEKENLKKHKNSGSNMFLTYVLRRETIKVSPKRGDPPPLHHISPSDETILHRLTLKRHDSLQDLEIIICKMTVCKRLWYSLQDDSLQGSNLV